MTSDNIRNNQSSTYIFQAAYGVQTEIERLDELHNGIKEYLGNQLSMAPLDKMNPKSILELGSGSGAWAIQAAIQFPHARVVAVDMSPLPERPLPSNVEFQKVDLTGALPFSPESFDIIHARLVVMHLPDGPSILRKVCELVKPGGWLLVEDPDDENMVDGDKPLGPAMSRFVSIWLDLMRKRGAQPCIGRDLERIIASTGLFAEINVKKVTIPMSQKSKDPAENNLGATWLNNARRVAKDIPSRYAAYGYTPELVRKHVEELEDPERAITTDLYFTWSRRG